MHMFYWFKGEKIEIFLKKNMFTSFGDNTQQFDITFITSAYGINGWFAGFYVAYRAIFAE